jgi:hypothetical protein
MNIRRSSYNFILVYSFVISLYIFIVFESENKYNIFNFILYFLSAFNVLFTITFNKFKLKNYDFIYLFIFSFFLFLNTLNFSKLQLTRDFNDSFNFLIIIYVPFLILNFTKKIRFKKLSLPNRFRLFSLNKFILFIILFFIIIKIYIGSEVGFRLFSFGELYIDGNQFTLPVYSGLSTLCMYLILINYKYLPFLLKIFSFLPIFIFNVVLHVKRGDFIRMAIIYIINSKVLTNRLKFIVSVSCCLLFFVLFGLIRSILKNEESDSIVDYLQPQFNSSSLSWIYAYTSFNFEILSLYLRQDYQPNFTFFRSLFEDNLQNPSYYLNISGFNAATYCSTFIISSGDFYIFELIVFSFLIAFLFSFSKFLNFESFYNFLLAFLCLLIFGNYIFVKIFLIASIISFFLFPFLKVEKSYYSRY